MIFIVYDEITGVFSIGSMREDGSFLPFIVLTEDQYRRFLSLGQMVWGNYQIAKTQNGHLSSKVRMAIEDMAEIDQLRG